MLRALTSIGMSFAYLAGCATAQIGPVPGPGPAHVQASTLTMAAMVADTAARKRELNKISGLVGKWTGPGWRILPTGERVEYDQTVLVTSKMGGQAFIIEGNSVRRPSFAPLSAGSMAVITWETDQNRYAFRSFTGGKLTEADGLLISPDTFQWVVKGPPLGLRFTVKFDANTWSEIGEVSRDGEKTWLVSYQLEMHQTTLP